MLVRLFSICLLFVGSVFSRDLIREQVDIYKTIMKAQGYDSLNVTSLTKLFSMHDDDSFCSPACERYLKSILKESDWEFFYTLISTIYAGQISEDPFMPQEIHLALTPSPTAMKVMWASMENLESPFCEYIPATSNDWSAAKSVVASNYTYRVTQKWWPIFTGVLYETDMVNLTPATKYRYRVGGWDTANSTTRYSAEFEFTAAPVSDSPNRATKVAFIADHGTFELLGFGVIRKMVELQPELNFELVMVGGDLSYAGLSSAMPALNIDKEDEVQYWRYHSIRQSLNSSHLYHMW